MSGMTGGDNNRYGTFEKDQLDPRDRRRSGSPTRIREENRAVACPSLILSPLSSVRGTHSRLEIHDKRVDVVNPIEKK